MRTALLALIAAGGLVACTSKGSAPAPKAPPADEAKTATAAAPKAASQPAVGPHGAPKAAPEKTEVHGLTNVSGVEYVKTDCAGSSPCRCAGTLVYGDNALAKIGVTKDKLTAGVWCVFGDFDDNEIADVAVLGADWSPEGGAAPVQVLLFDEVGLRATAPLPKRMRALGRAEVDGLDVLVEPAAKGSYYFRYSVDEGRFELVRQTATK